MFGEGGSRDSGDWIGDETLGDALERRLSGAESVLRWDYDRLLLFVLSRVEKRLVEESKGVAPFPGGLLPFPSSRVSFLDIWVQAVQAPLGSGEEGEEEKVGARQQE